VEALQKPPAGLTPRHPPALLVVLHIGALKSYLPDILNRVSALPARHAAQGEAIRAGHIYVAPPDHHLCVADHSLILSRGPRENWARPATHSSIENAATWMGLRPLM
jgi:two-component system, chemotaxis family, protein-glutamate methylesterase/glutaminase